MAMVCIRCSTTHEQALHCPTCGNPLTYVESRKPRRNYAEFARGWQHTDWGRFLIGVGLAQGLFYGLYHLVKSLYRAVTGQPFSPETMPFEELVCTTIIQLIGLLAGSFIAGVARRQAAVLGVYIAVANSILSLLLGQWSAYAYATHWVYAQPFVQIVFGATASLISSFIWKPLAVATLPESPSRMAKKLGVKRPRVLKLLGGQVSWVRVALGGVVGVAGCLGAPAMQKWILNNDVLAFDLSVEETVLLWEMRALAMLLGGMLAGVGTSNGLKQGLITGIIIGALLNISLAMRHTAVEYVGASMAMSFGLATLGAWFASQLFPPLASRKRAKGLGPGTL